MEGVFSLNVWTVLFVFVSLPLTLFRKKLQKFLLVSFFLVFSQLKMKQIVYFNKMEIDDGSQSQFELIFFHTHTHIHQSEREREKEWWGRSNEIYKLKSRWFFFFFFTSSINYLCIFHSLTHSRENQSTFKRFSFSSLQKPKKWTSFFWKIVCFSLFVSSFFRHTHKTQKKK